MEKGKFEKYVDIAFLVVGIAVFGFIMYFAAQFAYSAIKAIF